MMVNGPCADGDGAGGIPGRRAVLLLVLVLVVAAGLRLWNHDFDPLEDGNPLYHDAWAKFLMANEVAQGNWRVNYYKQPAFLIYTSGLILRASAFLGHTDRDLLWRLVVLYMVLCSTATVAMTYPIGKTVLESRGAALLATAFAAVIPASVVGSRYIKEDVPLALFVNVSVLCMLLLLKQRKHWWYLPSGIAVGLALATKYSAAGMVVVLLATHCLNVLLADTGSRRRTALSPWFFGGLAAVPAVFVLINPCVVSDWALFRETVGAQISYAAAGHNDGTAIRGYQYLWMFYLRHALLPGMTLPLLVAALAGAGWSVKRKNLSAMFLAAWTVFFYLSVENSPAKPFPFFVRYVHSLFPALCVFASFLFLRLWHGCGGRPVGRCLTAAAAAACVIVPLLKSAVVTHAVKRDTRMAATEWIDANIEEGARIYLDDVFYSPRPDVERFDVDYRRRMYHASLEVLEKREVDYVVLNSFRTDRYETCRRFSEEASRIHDYYRGLTAAGDLVRTFAPEISCQTYGFHNPVVSVYRMPWAGGD